MESEGARTFQKPAAAYDSLVGRYCPRLARQFIDWACVTDDDHVLDVGCGTGLLTAELAAAVGGARVAAVDPSEPFVAACKERVPDADVRLAPGEALPFEDDSFDKALSQLVVNFMTDAEAGVAEMRRVTRPGGSVAACVWDYADGMTLLRVFWDAAAALDPAAARLDEGVSMPHCTSESLKSLWDKAGFDDVRVGALTPSVRYEDFDDMWRPFTTGVAPSGHYTVSLGAAGQDALRREMSRRLGHPDGPFELSARAWVVSGVAQKR